MINNFNAIAPLLSFDSNQTYQILIMRRRKDFKDGDSPQKEDVRLIKDYYIGSIEKLNDRYEEMKTLAEIFQARVYVNLNARDTSQIGLKMLKCLSEAILSNSNRYKSIFRKAFAECQKVGQKSWIIDIDGDDAKDIIYDIADAVNSCSPVGEKQLAFYATKNGFHIISRPFHKQEFEAKNQELFYKCEIKYGDNPALLYLPKSLTNES